MVRYILFIFLILLFTQVSAQADVFSYQVALRGVDGNPPAQGSNIAIRISILDGSAAGNQLYREVHVQAINNNAGIVNLQIGNGTSKEGDLSNVIWTTPRFLKTEVDLAGGANYTDMGATQIFGVPYAIQAKRSTTADNALTAMNSSGLTIAGLGEDYLKHNGSTWIAEKFPFIKAVDSTLLLNNNINRLRYQDNNSSSYIEFQKKYSKTPYIIEGSSGFTRGLISVISNNPNQDPQYTGILAGDKYGTGLVGYSTHGVGIIAHCDSGIALNSNSYRGTASTFHSTFGLGMRILASTGAKIGCLNEDSTALELAGQLKVSTDYPDRQFAYQIAFQPANFSSVALTHRNQKITDIISVTPIYNGVNNTLPGYYVLWDSGTSTWKIYAASDDGTPSPFPGGCGFNILVIRR